jgi:hypothetical protein
MRNDPDTALLALNPRGYCIVATQTQRSVLAVWTQVVDAQRIEQFHTAPSSDATGAHAGPATPFTMSGTVPPSAIHMDGAYPGPDGSDGAVLPNCRGQG